ncbi:hypothetical protein Lal_00012407 [Lupinus albus]|uniref:Putative transcription factor MYB-HB-like family n=1 Tax=Lupinus albus TaxID=3870 RepID=A0A6A4P3B7_LUPAL|nr:putative transcription factor MYB-HB-like family [Lupinus albus]KAF1891515.1 hypothetical protein Lal_00012407 [Lupinus albus]
MNITTINDASNDENGLVSMISVSGGGGHGGVEEVALKKGPWTMAEDAILIDYVTNNGEGNWNAVQRNTWLARCGKSCRLRWANHLRPNLKKGSFSHDEEKLIVLFHSQFGNKWARMAALLPGRTDNEIKNYWNTRVKRFQRQGLPLYLDEHDQPTRPTIPSPCVTPTRSNTNTFIDSNFLHQNHHGYGHNHNHVFKSSLELDSLVLESKSPISPTAQQSHHSPLSSPLNHRQPPSSSPHHFMDPTPSNSNPQLSSLSFTFQKPTSVLDSALRFKRYRSYPNFSLYHLPSITPYSTSAPSDQIDLDAFRFPQQHSSSFSPQYFQTPLLDYERIVSPSTFVFSSKLEQHSNQFSQPQLQPEIMHHDIEFNDPTFQTSSGLLGDFQFDAQALASGHNSKKRSYFSLNEGNDVFDGYQNFEDTYWFSTSGVNPKEEASELSKSMNEDIAKFLKVMPSTMQGTEGNNNSEAEVSNVQSSSVTIDDNFGLDMKPIASLFPLTNATNHNKSQGYYYYWDNLPGLC